MTNRCRHSVLLSHSERSTLSTQQLSRTSCPFGSDEFKSFAECWEFVHRTSSPRFPQSNSRAENAVKTAKHLMLKASESGGDTLMALLDWRNTPSEQLGASPAQLMFGRCTVYAHATSDVLLSTASAIKAQDALTASKNRQASYYNCGTKERAALSVGHSLDATRWRLAQDRGGARASSLFI